MSRSISAACRSTQSLWFFRYLKLISINFVDSHDYFRQPLVARRRILKHFLSSEPLSPLHLTSIYMGHRLELLQRVSAAARHSGSALLRLTKSHEPVFVLLASPKRRIGTIQ